MERSQVGQASTVEAGIMANTDLKLATETLRAKSAPYTKLFQYYDGDQPLKYAAERLRDVFQDTTTKFVQNWCAVVVDATLDRLQLMPFEVTDDEPNSDRLNSLLSTTRIMADSDTIMRSGLITGESFVVAQRSDSNEIEAFYNDPRMVHVWYDAENPRQKSKAAKWWQTDDGIWHLNLYYPDHLERYTSRAIDITNLNTGITPSVTRSSLSRTQLAAVRLIESTACVMYRSKWSG